MTTFTDHREVSERCSIYRFAFTMFTDQEVGWGAECHVCEEEELFHGGTAEANATTWGELHECPLCVQLDETS